MKMIGISHSSCFNLDCNCRPDIFGIRTSTIRHAARVCKSDSRNSSADPKHRATTPADSIKSRSESCMASSSSMMAINLVISRVLSARSGLPDWLRSIGVSPLSRDTFTDLGRVVSEFELRSVRVAQRVQRPLDQGLLQQEFVVPTLFPHSKAMIANMGLCVLDEGAVIGTFLLNC